MCALGESCGAQRWNAHAYSLQLYRRATFASRAQEPLRRCDAHWRPERAAVPAGGLVKAVLLKGASSPCCMVHPNGCLPVPKESRRERLS
jgi:hypothetical protein